jgi:hypothetical protein
MKRSLLSLAALLTFVAGASSQEEGAALKVESVSEKSGMRVVLFTVANTGNRPINIAVTTCDGLKQDGSPVSRADAGVYRIAPGKSGIGEAAFPDLNVEKVDCRLTQVLR